MQQAQDLGATKFEVHFPNPTKIVKASPYTYSAKLDKVYVIDLEVCPVTIRTNRSFEELCKCQLRSWVAFKREGNGAVLSPEKVERCGIHGAPPMTDTSKTSKGILFCNDAFDYPDYEIHHSTLIKFDKLITTSRPALPEVTVNFKFACRSTCSSVGRKPLEWTLMLEDASGNEIARRTVNVKICKCPGRDMVNEENPKPKPQRGKRKTTCVVDQDIEVITVKEETGTPNKKQRSERQAGPSVNYTFALKTDVDIKQEDSSVTLLHPSQISVQTAGDGTQNIIINIQVPKMETIKEILEEKN